MSFYGTITGLQEHLAARGDASSTTGVAPDKLAAGLLVASEWLDAKYRSIYPGEKLGQREQVRDWPRSDAYDVNNDYIDYKTVPVEIERATYEATMQWLEDPTVLNPVYTPNRYTRASVSGAVSVDFVNFTGVADIEAKFSTVDRIMSGLLSASNGGSFSDLSGDAKRV